jgi:predicted MPP superfamily phosphohydrolase
MVGASCTDWKLRCQDTMSSGFGCSIMSVRIAVPPEIVVVTVRGGGESAL